MAGCGGLGECCLVSSLCDVKEQAPEEESGVVKREADRACTVLPSKNFAWLRSTSAHSFTNTLTHNHNHNVNFTYTHAHTRTHTHTHRHMHTHAHTHTRTHIITRPLAPPMCHMTLMAVLHSTEELREVVSSLILI
jgi:hypothetical protein